MAPDQEGRSFTSAKMAVFRDNAWQPAKEMSMEAQQSMTPSFEYTVPDSPLLIRGDATEDHSGVARQKISNRKQNRNSTKTAWHFE
jgi:hypothetical protein